MSFRVLFRVFKICNIIKAQNFQKMVQQQLLTLSFVLQQESLENMNIFSVFFSSFETLEIQLTFPNESFKL